MLVMMLQSFVHVAPKANTVVDAQSTLGGIRRQLQIMGNHHNGHILLPIDLLEHVL